MALADDISIRKEGRAGRITLTRQHAMNALTYDMAMAIEKVLLEWREDPDVHLILVDAEGDRAFCAGGDIEDLYEAGKSGDFEFGRKFWRDEYRLNALIAEYEKPYIAMMQGFTMGGGVGISCHGSHRIVCESSQIAMPECAIGLVPDVGGSFLLANAPGHVGEYLGLSGARMNAGDAIFAGFADSFVPQAQWDEVRDRLTSSGDPSVIDPFVSYAETGALEPQLEKITASFQADSVLGCMALLEEGGDDWAQSTVKQIRRGCPLSVACAYELIAMSRKVTSVRAALALELRFTWRSMSHGEFLEGVRAQIIDKDRNPQWKTARLEDVTEEQVQTMLAPLAEHADA